MGYRYFWLVCFFLFHRLRVSSCSSTDFILTQSPLSVSISTFNRNSNKSLRFPCLLFDRFSSNSTLSFHYFGPLYCWKARSSTLLERSRSLKSSTSGLSSRRRRSSRRESWKSCRCKGLGFKDYPRRIETMAEWS